MRSMLSVFLVSASVCLSGTLAVAAEDSAKVTPLMTKGLPDYPGREALMLAVEYGPGGSSPVHKHEADAFVYVVEGSIVMQVKGQKEVTLSPGEAFYESPSDIHLVSRNASDTKPAKFIVVLLKKKSNPVSIPVK
ncbi:MULTISPECIES: cupin domain-containing protein [unclassified Rhizobium]|uniref:cupin domain-containing protein n=1 Tax=unclassified Rhizobium TaxID=2613769 RepID=UPI000EAA9BB6|nr:MULTISPECIES: cupin domain-containing protein [unclassified Rhizobium]AYG70071.1 cupin domain-containing protein [Rhizobium sp. CCGE531]AYG76446.1 cupin domain-containing protein [Rhizobium sp. CCGE532]